MHTIYLYMIFHKAYYLYMILSFQGIEFEGQPFDNSAMGSKNGRNQRRNRNVCLCPLPECPETAVLERW